MAERIGDGSHHLESDAELVRRVLGQERGAVVDFIQRYERLVRRIVFRLVDDPRDREELCQNTFLKAIQSLTSFRAEASLSTWIGRIGYREGVQHLRRNRIPLTGPHGDVDPDALSAADPSPLTRADQQQLEECVRDAVAELTPAQRVAVTLFYLEEMGIADVAQVMGVPRNTVKSHLFRARGRLRSSLIEEARARGYTT